MHSFVLFAAAALLPRAVLAGVTGSATGFAYGVTGGGDAEEVTPTTTDELVSYLTDDEPRVILITQTFDFTDTEGTTTATGCVPTSNTCGSSGQDAINANDWCGDATSTEVTYYTAGTDPIYVASNKSIVGVGDAGVIQGRGFYLSGVSNVIIQNIHITDLNPEYIWGGDAISLVGTDMIWIDHCKFSLMGRQMIVTGYDAAGKVTISNNEFDGETSWSATCNGEHYWTMLFYGDEDYITLANNYVHHCSGRAPKVGSTGSQVMHAINNYFYDNDGHDFDVGEGGEVLMEGNVFYNVTTPITDDTASSGAYVFNVPDSSSASTCSSYLGRDCVINTVTDSGDFASYDDTNMLSTIGSASSIPEAMDSSEVAEYVIANAGIGKLSSSASSAVTSSAVVVAASSTSAAYQVSSSAVPSSSAVGSSSVSATFATSVVYSSSIATSETFSSQPTSGGPGQNGGNGGPGGQQGFGSPAMGGH